jgi:hypothetical protein
LKQEMEKLTQQKLFSGEEQEKICDENSMLKEKNQLIESQLNEAKFLINTQNISIGNTEQSFSRLKYEFEEAIEELSREKVLIVNDNAGLVADHDLVHYDNELLKNDIGLLKSSFEEFSAIKHSEIEAYLVEKKELCSEIEMLKTELNVFTSKEENTDSDLEKEIETLNLEIENLNHSLWQVLAETKERTASLEFEKSNLMLQVEELNKLFLEKGEPKNQVSEQENEEFIGKLFKQIDLLNDEKLQLSNQKEEVEEQVGILQQKLADLSQVIESQTGEIKSLEDRNKQVKLAQALVVSSKDKTATKLKINELVREIDKCIALLSV